MADDNPVEVEIIAGMFAGMQGTLNGINDSGAAQVTLTIFGRAIEVELTLDQIHVEGSSLEELRERAEAIKAEKARQDNKARENRRKERKQARQPYLRHLEKLRSNDPRAIALESSILNEPDEMANYAAYGDYLAENGDPRGEMIQVQMALEEPSLSEASRQKLEKRQAELWQAHHAQWLGAMASFLPTDWPEKDNPAPPFRFARGWFEQISFSNLSKFMIEDFARSPLCQALRSMVIRFTNSEEAHEALFVRLASTPHITNLRSLQIGTESGSTWFEDDLFNLIEEAVRLEELSLYGGGNPETLDRIFQLQMPRLKKLVVHHSRYYPLTLLADNASLAGVEHLSFVPHCQDGSGPFLHDNDIFALFRSPHLENLRHLELHQTDIGDNGCTELVCTDLFSTLKVLSLWSGSITDEGAMLLASHPDFARLELLDISRNALTEDGIDALRETGVNIIAAYQRSQEDIENLEHLSEGDIE